MAEVKQQETRGKMKVPQPDDPRWPMRQKLVAAQADGGEADRQYLRDIGCDFALSITSYEPKQGGGVNLKAIRWLA